MALSIQMSINGHVVGYATARRTAPGANGGLPGPDEVHRYEVVGFLTDRTAIRLMGRGEDHGMSVRGLSVEHRYGDGVMALSAKVLDVVSKALDSR